jgi:M6 family metalloprotease-like protein
VISKLTKSLRTTAFLALGVAGATWSGEQAAASGAERIEGVMGVVWADPRPGQLTGASMRFEVLRGDGRVLQVEVPPALRTIAISGFGKRVVITGHTALDATTAAEKIVARALEVADPVDAAAVDRPRAVTRRRVLSIMVRFKGDAQQPHSARFFHALTNPKRPSTGLGIPASINGFFNKTTWGQLVWRGDVAGVGGLAPTRWLTLPKTKAEYAPCGSSSACADVGQIFTDAVALARNAGVALGVYDNINIMLNNDLDCCAWGGSRFLDGKLVGVTWNPPWAQEPGVFVHELGHSLGLPHSGWVYFAYDSHWDQMSRGTRASSLKCGTYRSANNGNAVRDLFCHEPGAGYIAAHKEVLGWLPAANILTISSPGTRTVVLESNAAPLGTAKKMVKVCLAGFPCTGASARYLTVEARIRSHDYEKALPNEGVVIHDFMRNRGPIGGACFFNQQSGWAVPIDSTRNDYDRTTCSAGNRPYPNWGLHNAQFGVGKTYRSNSLGVRVEVLSRAGNTFRVRVTRTK